MKIYSLQEENEKLNAARGIPRPRSAESMFEMSRRGSVDTRTKKSVSAKQMQSGTSTPTIRQLQKQNAQTARQLQKQTAQPARQPQKTTASPARPLQNTPPQTGKKRAAAIGWILFVLFILAINFLMQIFE